VFNVDIKLFYKTQRELATALNNIVDAYWEDSLSEDELLRNVLEIYTNNPKKIFKNNGFTSILKQQCGKRRLEVIKGILHMNGLLQNEPFVV
jgi:uncharacterized protein (TIGR04540 family)